MIDKVEEVDSKNSPIEFVKTKGSQVTGRYKEKKERINEAMCDLQLALDGHRVQLIQSEQLDQSGLLQQSAAAFARACSMFLRKMVIGDRNQPNTRLLDNAICRSLEIKFDRLRKISLNRVLLDIGFSIDGGSTQIQKLDETTLLPQSVHNLPIAPIQLNILIEWPLPGAVGWTDQPTQQKPWQIKPEELFATNSNDTLSCDRWLGQQLVMFDNKGLTLKDVIRTVVTYEGAHSTNVSRLMQSEHEKDVNPAQNPELHILNNIKTFGIKFSHIIVIESALYLYKILLENKEIERPKGEIYLATLCLIPHSSENVFSNHRSWLAYDGGISLSFGSEKKLISHRIRAVK